MTETPIDIGARMRARAESAIKELGLTEREAIVLDGLVAQYVVMVAEEAAGTDVTSRKAILAAAWQQIEAAQGIKVARATTDAFRGVIVDLMRAVIGLR